MEAHNYWYMFLKKRGLKHPGKPSIKKISYLVSNYFNEDAPKTKKQAKKYLLDRKEMQVKANSKNLPAGIYFIGNETENVLKVGRSKNPSERIKKLQIACPFKLEIFHILKTFDAVKLERKAHKKLQHLRLRGEWFILNQESKNIINEFVIINRKQKKWMRKK